MYLFTFCSTKKISRELRTVDDLKEISSDHRYLKAHLKDGNVYVLNKWHFKKQSNTVLGYGKLLDINRVLIESRKQPNPREKRTSKDSLSTELFEIPLDKVAIFETNDTGESLGSYLAIVTGISLSLTVYCITNPKACFGSCPTFYSSNGDRMILQAEGFSSSIAPILERKDLDMLYYTQNKGDEIEIKMTNEALETHVIRKVDLVVVPKPKQGRVFATKNGNFYSSSHIYTPNSCTGSEGEFVDAVCSMDDKERLSLSDSSDLAKKELLNISFDSIPTGKYGLVIGARQTLLTTYLFYQNLSYMGNSVAYWAAKFQSMEKEEFDKKYKLIQLLGGIDISLKQKRWDEVGQIRETGPIATNVELIELPDLQNGKVHLKLKCTKGLWRLNYLALVSLDKKMTPVYIQPHRIISNNEEDSTFIS